MLEALAASVVGVGPGKSLPNTVAEIIDAVDGGDIDEACSTLGAFQNKVRAQSGKKITRPKATQLIADAQQIADALDCD